ncbi:unnamed protein product [Caenorhabditis bovis]|uniref:Tyrosine-protein phosphatase domain-containing protein n=1 Tax=Caenorhabditis bovis TaxID=2654633 RepID=A0A8S1EKH5_9PELO|nr:unnamed protein product [Caenorhabditis bovis]
MTKNSCTRPLENFIKLVSRTTVPREFSSFTSVELTRPNVVDMFYEYPKLNRYNDVVVYEKTRVRAPQSTENHNYINASWVDGFREHRKFIVTQTPLSTTNCQFWQMIYDRKSFVVVFLSRIVDEQKEYIVPRKVGDVLKFGLMTIELVHVRNVNLSYDSAVVKLTKENEHSHDIIVITYHGWGPTSYPCRPSDVLALLTDINHMRDLMKKKEIEEKNVDPKSQFPVTLICMDGIGRSCTVAALDILCRRLEYSSAFGTPYVDVLDTIARLRMLRAAACPRAEQFIFLSMSMLEFALRSKLVPKEMLYDVDLTNYIVGANE